jgi:regulator of PEP synthase PpsR (kinase-PPPase family)
MNSNKTQELREMIEAEDLFIEIQMRIIESQNKEIEKLKNEISNLILSALDPKDGIWN